MCKTSAPISFWGPLTRQESHALDVLWTGLCHLNAVVRKLEEDRLQQHPKSKDMMIMSFDSACGSGDTTLLNYFFWYACSADSFLDLFQKSFAPREDTSVVFGTMRKFRDKIAAHLSHVQPRRDNRETQSASLRQYITWDCGRYSVGREVTVDYQDRVGSGERSPANWGWELTKIHEEIDAFVRRNLQRTGT